MAPLRLGTTGDVPTICAVTVDEIWRGVRPRGTTPPADPSAACHSCRAATPTANGRAHGGALTPPEA